MRCLFYLVNVPELDFVSKCHITNYSIPFPIYAGRLISSATSELTFTILQILAKANDEDIIRSSSRYVSCHVMTNIRNQIGLLYAWKSSLWLIIGWDWYSVHCKALESHSSTQRVEQLALYRCEMLLLVLSVVVEHHEVFFSVVYFE